MVRFLAKLFSEKFVIPVNLFLFVTCILFGVAFYGSKLHGAGDDMNNISAVLGNGSSLEYVKWLYLYWGQTGAAILIVPIQVVVKLLHVTPEGFPWWFYASYNTFCYLAAAYMLVMGGKRLLRYEWREALFLLSFIYGVWLTPVMYNSTIQIPVTFGGYAVPTYLLTIAIYLFSGNSFGQNKKDWLMIGCVYLVASLITIPFLFSIPILFTGIVVVRALQERYNLIKIIGNIGFFAALSLASAIFTWTQPGFHIRPVSLNIHIPSFLEIAQWYIRALDEFGFLMLMENHTHLAHLVRYLIPFLLLVIIFGLWVWRKYNIQMNSCPQIVLLLSKAVWALTLILGFLFCMVPLLFSGYYPNYTSVYPTLLMSGVLGLSLSFLIHLFKPSTISEILVVFGKPFVERHLVDPDKFFPVLSVTVAFFPKQSPHSRGASFVHRDDGNLWAGGKNFSGELYYSYWSWVKWLAVVPILGFIFYFNTIPHLNGIYKAYQVELISSAIRQDFQKKIEVAYYKTGQKVYIVAGCPKGIMVEQFWGISGYFYWKGVDDIFGVLDTDPNLGGLSPQEVWPDKKSWYKIDCLKITSKQLEILQP